MLVCVQIIYFDYSFHLDMPINLHTYTTRTHTLHFLYTYYIHMHLAIIRKKQLNIGCDCGCWCCRCGRRLAKYIFLLPFFSSFGCRCRRRLVLSLSTSFTFFLLRSSVWFSGYPFGKSYNIENTLNFRLVFSANCCRQLCLHFVVTFY